MKKFKAWTDEKEVCETCGQEIDKSNEYTYLRLKEFGNTVSLRIVDKHGNKVACGNILSITDKGTLYRNLPVNKNYIQRDSETRIKLSE